MRPSEPSFRLLGPVEVVATGGPVPVPGALRRALLALLLLDEGRVLPLSTIIRGLWGDTPPATAPAQVRAAVAAIRRALRPAGLDPIVTHPAGYLARVPAGSLDVSRFRALVRDAQSAGRDPVAVRDDLRRAAGLWRGEALSGAAGAFVAAARAGLAEERRGAEEDLLDAELRLGGAEEVLPRLTALVTADPLRERPHELLMLALYRAGRPAEALAVYRRLRASLAAEQGIEPGPRLSRLHEACLRRDPVLDGPPPPVPPPVPPSVPPARPPAQLPVAPAPFVGRDEDLARLDDAMRPGGVVPPLTVITGPPGVGKSALALAWAHRHRARFPDGQLYLDLHGHDGGEPVPAAVGLRRLLTLLGVGPDRQPVEESDLAATYRSALDGRRLLVLLDNVADTAQVRALVPGSSSTAVLATGRRRPDGLAVDHAVRMLELAPLDRAASVALLASMAGAGRVDGDRTAADDLARLCGDFPLALRVAAAKLVTQPALSVAELRRRLAGDGGRLAEIGRLTVDGARRSVDLTIGYSYRDLDPDTATALRRLSVHPGDTATVDHVAVLAGVSRVEAERRVEELTAANLVAPLGGGRIRLHDLIRAYLAVRLRADPAEEAAAADRLVSLYLRVAAVAGDPQALAEVGPLPDGVRVPVAEDAALAWLDAERAVLEPVARLAVDHRPQLGWLASRLFGRYFNRRGGWPDYLPIARLGVRATLANGDRREQARARTNLGMAHLRLRQLDEAGRELRAAGELGTAVGDVGVAGRAMNNLAIVEHLRRRYPVALAAYRQAARLQVRSGDLAGGGMVLSNIGEAYAAMDDLGRALRYHRTAVRVRRAFGSRSDVANALANLGGVQVRLGAFEGASATLVEGLAAARDSGDRMAEAQVLGLLGRAFAGRGETAAAVVHLRDGARLYRDQRDPHHESLLLAELAGVHLAAGECGPAREALDRAAALRSTTPDEAGSRRIAALRATLDDRHRLPD
jgi:DNA-binding SARP family transcriptional activator/Tfp pilus assembly protein PilF